jgi:ribosomal-protein-alanine N-acetyltransferase
VIVRRERHETDGDAGAALPDVRIAPMRHRHLRAVLQIEEAVYPRPWSANLFVSEIGRRADRRYVVALAPGPWSRRQAVGYAGVLVQSGEAHVSTVAVHPAYRRRKIATRLLLELMREAVALGAEAATLEVRTGNRGAQRLYQAFGFAPVGVRPGYYAETGEDALIMWVHDLQGAEFAATLARQAERLAQRREGGS